ncbi:MAG: hypothetical protein R3C53_27525 [Pirellulaceae bacterium]
MFALIVHRLNLAARFLIALSVFADVAGAQAQPAVNPDPGPEPILRIDTGGHSSYVSSLAWNPHGHELWSAGWDKTVRVWRANADGRFSLIPGQAVRVPIGPGPLGKIDTIAFSDDGRWLAIGGYGCLVQRAAGFAQEQSAQRTISSVELLEQGVILVLDRQTGTFTRLEGHRGPVRRLMFARTSDGTEQLVSAGFDIDAQQRTIGSLRTWDIAAGKQIAGVLMPEKPDNRPSLVVRPSPSGPSGLQVIAGWGNEKFYQWDSALAPRLQTFPDGQYNTLFSTSDANWFASASGSATDSAGQVKFWNFDSNAKPVAEFGRQIRFPRQNGEMLLPLGATTLSSQASGKPDHIVTAVCVIRSLNGRPTPERFELRVSTLPENGRVAQLVMRRELWRVDATGLLVPDLAASPDGKYLAIAGNPNHSILIYPVAQLLRGGGEPQSLSGETTPAKNVEFVQRGTDLGLRIANLPSGQTTRSEILFNLSKSRIEPASPDAVPAAQRWLPAKPTESGWTAVRSTTDTRQLSVFERGLHRHSLRIPNGHILTDYVFTGVLPQTSKSLLIVSAHEDGQPWLGVYDLADGQLKRVLRAHTEPITSLSVSADNRLLASASNDQTIGIWNLADVDRLLAPRATLEGVALIQQDHAIKVEAIRGDGNPTTNLLRVGDQLVGYFEPQQPSELVRWESAEDVYLSLYMRQGGSQLKLRVGRNGREIDLQVPLQQAVETRTPLFQLLLTQGDAGREHWIGWSPLGPFDASDQQIRSRLGWHFNERKPERPVSFVPVDEYPKLYQPGMISKKVKDLDQLQPRIPLAFQQPRMKLRLMQPDVERWNDQGLPEIRTPPHALSLTITNTDFPNEIVEAIELRIDGNQHGAFTLSSENRWQLNELEIDSWSRGVHSMEVQLVTNEDPARTFRLAEQVAYLPPAPTIELKQPPPLATRDTQVAIAGTVTPQLVGQAFEVQLLLVADKSKVDNAQDAVEVFKWQSPVDGQPLDFTHMLELQEGPNVFVLRAINAGANEETGQFETATLRLETVLVPRDENPPEIEITSIQQVTPSGPRDLDSRVTSGQYVASAENIVISGKLSAPEQVSKATVNGEPLPGFEADTEVTFKLPVRLQPGMNTFRFATATQVSAEALREVVVDYRQPLPEVEFIRPFADQVITSILPNGTVEIEGVFRPQTDQRPLNAQLILDGNVLDVPLTVNFDAAKGTIKGAVPLNLGNNSLQLLLKNDCGVQSKSPPLKFHYQPIPVVERQQVPEMVDGATFAMQLSGVTATDIQRVLIDNRELGAENWTHMRDGERFVLNFSDLPIETGRTQSVLSIFSEGATVPVEVTIPIPRRTAPLVLPPQVAFLSPSEDSSVTTEIVEIEYLVQSSNDLKRIELRHDGSQLALPEFLPADDAPVHRVRQQLAVRLRPGVNRFELLGENRDGLRTTTLSLNFIPSPVSLELTSLTPVQAGVTTDAVPLTRRDDGSWGLQQSLKAGSNLLRGRVRWNYADEATLNNSRLQVWVAVNGFKQPVGLLPREEDSLEREFVCPVQLFRVKDNWIEVTSADLPELRGTRAVAHVDCDSPELARQRLHLVIVGVGVPREEEQSLMSQAVASLSGSGLRELKSRNEFVFQSPAFAECIGYGPYIGPVVSREKIGSLLELIRLRIFQSQKVNPANDVLLVYYRGGEQVYDGGQFYLTTQQTQTADEAAILRDSVQLRHFAVSSDSLATFVDHCPGTQLLLLDVARIDAQGTRPPSPDFVPGAATFRYAWLRGMGVPTEARLISAWNASPSAHSLEQIERTLAEQYETLSHRFENAISYENHLPPVLRDLQLGVAQ